MFNQQTCDRHRCGDCSMIVWLVLLDASFKTTLYNSNTGLYCSYAVFARYEAQVETRSRILAGL